MELDIHFAFHDFIGMFTSWGINCPTVLTFGVNSTSSSHLLILVKILFNELSFLGTWERFELFDTGAPTPPPPRAFAFAKRNLGHCSDLRSLMPASGKATCI